MPQVLESYNISLLNHHGQTRINPLQITYCNNLILYHPLSSKLLLGSIFQLINVESETIREAYLGQ